MSSQPQRRKARRYRDIQRRKSLSGVAGRERLRRERNASECGAWPLVASRLICVHASPDGRNVAMHAWGCGGAWYRCGTERAVRGALAKLLWRCAI